MDVRKQKAEERIYEAIIALLKKESFDSISIKEILSVAKVSRTTFYRLFEDKYDLLNRTLLYATGKYVNPERFASEEWREFFADFLSRLKLSRTMKTVFQHTSPDRFIAVNSQFFRKLMQDRMERCQKHYDESLNLELNILSAGCASALYYWMKTDFTIPVEDLIERVHRTVPESVKVILNI